MLYTDEIVLDSSISKVWKSGWDDYLTHFPNAERRAKNRAASEYDKTQEALAYNFYSNLLCTQI